MTVGTPVNQYQHPSPGSWQSQTPQATHPMPGSWGNQVPQSAGGYGHASPGNFMPQQHQGAPFGRGFGGYQG